MGDLTRKKILLVEDDLINQFAVQKFISHTYDVVATDNSESADEIFSSQKIDLVLMDISIKGKINGLQLTEKLKKSLGKEHIPVIALTAYAFPQDRINCLNAGCSDFLAKPYTKDELLKKIALFLG